MHSRGEAMPSCLCVCVCVHKKILKNASSRVAKASRHRSQRKTISINHIRMFLYLQVVLYAIISATSYYWLRGSTPFEIASGSYSQQQNLYHGLQVICQWTELENLKMTNQNWVDVICDGSNWSVLNYNCAFADKGLANHGTPIHENTGRIDLANWLLTNYVSHLRLLQRGARGKYSMNTL